MASITKLVLAALTALVAVGVAGAWLKEIAIVTSPAPKRPASLTAVSDPAEPAMTVKASFDNGAPGGVPQTGWTGRPVAVAGGTRGATLTLDTPALWQGRAVLSFKDAAPPMRFTLRLTKMQNYDLESLTVASGSLSLAVGAVSAGVTTKYFDARGRAQDAPEGAAYTVTARRWDGEVDVQVRRARGASLGKELSLSWRSNLNYGRGGLGRR